LAATLATARTRQSGADGEHNGEHNGEQNGQQNKQYGDAGLNAHAPTRCTQLLAANDDAAEGEPPSALFGLRFFMRNGLLYFRDDFDSRERLCILRPLHHEVFRMAHDQHHHAGYHRAGYHRAYDRVQASFFVKKNIE
jgi:hypothetical protein